MRPQFSGVRRIYAPTTQYHQITSQWSADKTVALAKVDEPFRDTGMPRCVRMALDILGKPYKGAPIPPKKARQQAPRVPRRESYVPKQGHAEAALYRICDKSTGHVLARIRGESLHVYREAQRLAISHGFTSADLTFTLEKE